MVRFATQSITPFPAGIVFSVPCHNENTAVNKTRFLRIDFPFESRGDSRFIAAVETWLFPFVCWRVSWQ